MAKTIQEKINKKKLQKLRRIYLCLSRKQRTSSFLLLKSILNAKICYKALLLAYRTEKKQDIKESSLKINLADAKNNGAFQLQYR